MNADSHETRNKSIHVTNKSRRTRRANYKLKFKVSARNKHVMESLFSLVIKNTHTQILILHTKRNTAHNIQLKQNKQQSLC